VCELCVFIFVQTKFFNGCQVALSLGFCVILEGEQGLRKNIQSTWHTKAKYMG